MQSATADSARFTALIDLTNDIEQRLALASVISGATYRATYVESSTQLYDIAALEQHSVFRSVITITYRLTT
jgi:6,7-dimethyl-8-ribityllumazine synthase